MDQDDQRRSFQSEDPSAAHKAMEFLHHSTVAFALLAALKLKVFDILAAHGHPRQRQLSAAQILSHLHAPAPNSSSSIIPDGASVSGLDRLLRLLASHSLLTSSVSPDDNHDGAGSPLATLYGLTPTSSFFLHPHPPHDHEYTAPNTLAPLYLLGHHDAYIQAWLRAPEAILEGVSPFFKAHSKHLFAYAHDNSQFGQLFDLAMATSTNLAMQSLLRTYHGFDGLTSLVDVGGGPGAASHTIVSKYPHIKAINFDLPRVIQAAPKYEGVQHLEGNMFDSIPQAEAIFMKHILHNWSDEECIQILKNCYHAIPTSGKVIIIDSVLPSNIDTEITNQHCYAWDLLMFIVSPGGRQRTLGELKELARLAGPFKVQVICKIDYISVLEMYKA